MTRGPFRYPDGELNRSSVGLCVAACVLALVFGVGAFLALAEGQCRASATCLAERDFRGDQERAAYQREYAAKRAELDALR